MKQRRSKLIFFAIFTTLAILAWVFSEAYSKLNPNELTAIPAQVIAPINPSLDTTILDSIEQKVWFLEGNTTMPLPSTQVEPTQETETQQTSPSGEANPAGEARE